MVTINQKVLENIILFIIDLVFLQKYVCCKFTYFCTQCAEVSTQPGLIRTPPHQCPMFPKPGIFSRTETCQGQDPSLVSFPWIILPLLYEWCDLLCLLDDCVRKISEFSNMLENKLNSFDRLLGVRWFGTTSLIPHFSVAP